MTTRPKTLLIIIAGFCLPLITAANFFEPRLPNGCTVDATERAWVEAAKIKLPKQAKPKILTVVHGDTAHSYCVFMTPRGTWFCYNPDRGSEWILEGDEDAMSWGLQCNALATGATLED